MKLSMFLLPIVLFVSTFSLDKITNRKPARNVLTEVEKEFLLEMADARMIDLQQSQCAVERATNPKIREYGKTMMRDQETLMTEINELAAAKNVLLPKSVNRKKARAISDLKKETGMNFDEKFIRMMIIDHRRDLKYLRRATKFDDPAVRMFASKHLALIESHLATAKALSN